MYQDENEYKPRANVIEKPWLLEIGFGGRYFVYEYISRNDAVQAARAFWAYPSTYKVNLIDLNDQD